MSLFIVAANQIGLLGTLVFVISFTSPNSLLRPCLLPLIITHVFYILPLNKDTVAHKGTWTLLNMNTAGLLLQYIDLALISRWSYAAYGPTSSLGNQPNASLSVAERRKLKPQTSSSLFSRLQWGFEAAVAWRFPATPWEAKGTPHFTKVPSRRRFITMKTLQLIWALLILDAMSLMGSPPDPAANAIKFSWEKVRIITRLSDVTKREVVLRIIVVYIRWVAIYFYVQAFYCLLAILAVGTGISEERRWPPFFGSVADMFTVRGTWGNFWHQSIRQKISSPAYYTTYSLLGLRKGGVLGRYTYILLTFTVSGLFHLIAEEYPDGIKWQQSGTVLFYSMQALGIMLEDTVQEIFRRGFGYTSSRWARAFGYVWVVLWTLWTSPAYFYPMMLVITEKKSILPFSVVGPLVQRFKTR